MEKNKGKKQAVALGYDIKKDSAPRIIASGQGIVAENIIKTAEENEIAQHQDEKLVKELIQFKVGTEIPPELYEVVAQIFVFVETVDREKAINSLW